MLALRFVAEIEPRRTHPPGAVPSAMTTPRSEAEVCVSGSGLRRFQMGRVLFGSCRTTDDVRGFRRAREEMGFLGRQGPLFYSFNLGKVVTGRLSNPADRGDFLILAVTLTSSKDRRFFGRILPG